MSGVAGGAPTAGERVRGFLVDGWESSTSSQRKLAVGVLVAFGLWALSIVFPHSWPSGFLAQGVLYGSAAGVLAIGLVLVYRMTRVINFAYGAMGSFAAEVGVFTYHKHHLPWLVCVGVAVVAGMVVGVAVDLLLRRFANAPRLVVTVATIGLLQVFTGLQFATPFFLHGPTIEPSFPTGLDTFHFNIGSVIFYGNDLLAVGIVPVVLIGLTWFLLRTESGTAVRAIAENADRARLLGIPIKRLSRLVWIIVGGLAALVTVLSSPSNGVPIATSVSVGGLFIYALAAAVVAKMESLPVAFGTAVALGVIGQIVAVNVHKQAVTTVFLLVVIVVALLFQRRGGTRAEGDESSWALSSSRRPLPAAVANLPEIVYGRVVLLVVIIGLFALYPVVAVPSRVHTMSGYLLLGIAVLSLVVLSGWSGTISLGQFAIVGVGAVVAGDLIVKANIDLFVALLAAALGGALIAVVAGFPALRVRPLFVAVTTIVFAGAMEQYFLEPANYPDLIPQSILRPNLMKRYPLNSETAMYFLCLSFLVLTMAVVWSLRRTRTGRVLLAGRDNPKAAAAVGIPVRRIQLVGMAISGVIAGVAGGLYGVLQLGVGSSSYPLQTSVVLFAMAVVGGLGSMSGALCGLAAIELLEFLMSQASAQASSLASFAVGALMLFVLIVFPGGIAEAIERVRDRIVAALAGRRGIAFEVGAAAGSSHVVDVAPVHVAVAGAPDLDGDVLLRCRSVTASYGTLQVLFGVDLEVAEGEMVALLGTNGAGKSTVFKTICNLLPATGGAVELAGRSLRGMDTEAIACRGLSMMPGGRGIFPTLTVDENLRLACWQLRGDHSRASASRDEMLALFPILAERRRQLAGNLSGGEQQQLSLAMAFVTKPKLLLVDELSLGLAPTVVKQLCAKVREIHRSGTTVVLVEQSVSVALLLAERAVFLEKGQVRFEGPTVDLLDRPDILRSVFIGGAGTRDRGEAQTALVAPAAPPTNGSLPPAGERVDAAPADDRSERPSRGVELLCRGIVKRFGGITAINRADLTIPADKIVGLIGHNGAGKTTLFDVISGFLTPEAGLVVLDGEDITELPAHRRAIGGLGRSFQEARLFPSLTVAETVAVALEQHLANRDPLAAALALPASLNSEASAAVRVDELVELLGLGAYADTPTAELSTGTRRIVELACVLAADPAVLLLDEPSAGVAQKETEALGGLLRRVQAETGCAIAIIEHDMALMTSLCDELVALDQGAVICTGTPDEVLAHPRVVESYLGTEPIPGDGAPGSVANGAGTLANGQARSGATHNGAVHNGRATRTGPLRRVTSVTASADGVEERPVARHHAGR